MAQLIFISFLIIVLLLIVPIAAIVLILILNMLYTNLKTHVPWARIPQTNLQYILSEINLPKNSLVYDLGCGDGRFLFLAEKNGLKAIGYELAYYPYLKALTAKFLMGSKVKIENKDFFKQDLSGADAIFIFLTASVMEKIGIRLLKNLKTKTIVASYGFRIPGWETIKILETSPSKTYIYKSNG